MSEFKVGDTVRRITCDNEGNRGSWVLKVGTICKVIHVSCGTICVKAAGVPEDAFHSACYFELVKESEMFDLKKNPWYIKVNSQEQFNAVQEWLLDNFGDKFAYGYEKGMCLSNTNYSGERLNNIAWYIDEPKGRDLLKIKFTYKTTVDKVEWPVVESETQKKLRELEEQQRKIAEDIAKLRESL